MGDMVECGWIVSPLDETDQAILHYPAFESSRDFVKTTDQTLTFCIPAHGQLDKRRAGSKTSEVMKFLTKPKAWSLSPLFSPVM